MINEFRIQCKTFLNKECRDIGFRLVRFDGVRGIVKCNHLEKEDTIKFLKSIKKISSNNVNIETLGTSGTIKALTKKYMNEIL
jgi:RNase P/RNase MRP subunit POP5